MLADPRRVQSALAFYMLNGQPTADAALGRSWGMERWSAEGWTWQWDVEGMAYSRLFVGTVSAFETIDFFGKLPLEIRKGRFSAKVQLYHQSSHLGDNYIERTGTIQYGRYFSVEGLRGQASFMARPWLRLYGGDTQLLHTIPSLRRQIVQGGFEASTRQKRLTHDTLWSLYLAQDVQSQQYNHWNPSGYSVLGLRLTGTDSGRTLRLQLGYFAGHSPFGQFYDVLEHYADCGIIFDF